MIKLLIFAFLTLLSFYSFYYCPNDLEITVHTKSYSKATRSIKIAHITDLHTKGLGTIEQKLLDAIHKEKPDIIVITGDLSTPNGSFEGYQEVLSKVAAPKGVFFVNGNWEYWNTINKLKELLNKNNITYLNNKIHKIDSSLNLIGFDDIEGRPDLDITDDLKGSTVNIGLFHSPSFFKKIPNKIKLSLAGHSHGGQIKIPFFGPIWTPNGTGEFNEGWFQVEERELYVSRGIGNSILPVRFNCRPELAIFNINY